MQEDDANHYPWWLRLWDWAFDSPRKKCLYCHARKYREQLTYFPPAGFFCNLEEYELFRWLTN